MTWVLARDIMAVENVESLYHGRDRVIKNQLLIYFWTGIEKRFCPAFTVAIIHQMLIS